MNRVFALALATMVATPATATTPAPAAAAGTSLHDRVIARVNYIGEADLAEQLKAVRALLAEEEAQARPDADDRAQLQVLLTVVLSDMDDNQGALAVLDQGIAQLQAAGLGDSPRVVEMLMNKATVVGDMGRRDEADVLLHQVLDIQSKRFGPDSVDVGTTMCLIAFNANRQGRLAYAIEQARRGLVLMKPDDKNRMAWMSYHTVLFDALSQSGRVEEALVLAREVQALTEQYLQPDHIGAAVALANLSAALNDAGRFAEGEQIARRAVDQEARFRGKASTRFATDLRNLAKSLSGQGHLAEAEALVMASEQVFADLGAAAPPKLPATLLVDAAVLARLRGDNATADARVAQALAFLAHPRKGDEFILARAWGQRALGSLIAGHPAEGLPAIQTALTGMGELPLVHPVHLDVVMLQGLLLARTGQAAQGLAQTLPAARAMETVLTANTTARSELINLAPAYAHNFERFAAIALAAGDTEAAFRAAQFANMSALAVTNSAVAARAAASDPAVAALARGVQDMIARRAGLDRERSFALGKSPAEVARIDALLATLDRDLAAGTTALNAQFPNYQTLSRPAPISLHDAMAALSADQALLIPLAVDDGFLSIIVTRQGLEWQQSRVIPAAVTALVGTLRAAVEPGRGGAGGFPADQAWQLYAALVPPALRAALAHKRDLVLFGGGPVATIPLGMLLTARPPVPVLKPAALRNAAWLIRDHSVAVVATLDHPAGTTRIAAATPSFAGIGAPTLAPAAAVTNGGVHLLRGGIADLSALRQLPSLPGAAAELRAISTALHAEKSLLLLGDDASESRVRTADLSQYRVLAFATHGLVGGISAIGEPALVLTPPAMATAQDDGILTASEAATLRLDADWVILSACDSAGATDGATPTYSGLARAFFQAGSKSLLVSMWPVRDDIAARLTVATVTAGQRMSKARALQAAALAVLRDARVRNAADPANWAPFTLLER
ncbi:CHAT domain-containing tetratricopeptide repeat protein [Novosphingobium sp.]|uniref:CHAT domain-containing protein n=1 Tax=Novosphingobium sp. TaxID=1874826 RepID=UPI00333EC21D